MHGDARPVCPCGLRPHFARSPVPIRYAYAATGIILRDALREVRRAVPP